MKIKLMHPLISCICITKKRPSMLLCALEGFEQQGYPNKELVISVPAKDIETIELIHKIIKHSPLNIYLIVRPDEESLGIARNKAIEASHGEYICLWDDDDSYNPNRLYAQHNGMQGNNKYFQSSILDRVFIYDADTKKSYLSLPYLWPGSLLCKKNHFLQHPCKDVNQFECAPVIEFLLSKGLLYIMSSNPQLYTFTYHGENTLDEFNLQYLLRKSEALYDGYLQNATNYTI